MRLTADDLVEIAGTITKIRDAKLDVEVVTVRGHRVILKRTDSQRDGMEYFVIGITDGELASSLGKVMREADADSKKPGTGHLPGRPPLGGSRR